MNFEPPTYLKISSTCRICYTSCCLLMLLFFGGSGGTWRHLAAKSPGPALKSSKKFVPFLGMTLISSLESVANWKIPVSTFQPLAVSYSEYLNVVISPSSAGEMVGMHT
ncbi:hypothetical protein K438DRAFT_1784818 [Mycena galopus ATCC 62051]|nr:hypothetical protein K438DRAFT_1784818 [Mycena galopus ATCC 62051]